MDACVNYVFMCTVLLCCLSLVFFIFVCTYMKINNILMNTHTHTHTKFVCRGNRANWLGSIILHST